MHYFLIFSVVLATCFTAFATDTSKSVIRVTTTLQGYSPSQPWDKTTPTSRHALGAVLSNNQVLTTAEMVTNANFIQLETTNGQHQISAEVIAVDYEANLALLAANSEKGKEVLSGFTGLEISPPAHLGDTVDIVQIEDNGMELITKGTINSASVVSSFISDQYFLNYEIKASMQSAANSYTLPALKDGKLLGLLTSYSSKDQLVDLVAPEIISAFLEDAKDGDYRGFPSLGIATSRTTDPHFRDWLKLPNDIGGLYVTRVLPNSSGEKAGIKPGDVLTSVSDKPIDRKGFYKANGYGQLYWSHLIRGTKPVGSQVKIGILREGKKIELTATLGRSPVGIIPPYTYDKAPRYLLKGGLIFQELTRSYLEAFGKNWSTQAPLNLLDALNHPEDYAKGRKRLVFLSAVIPTPATLGYESLRSAIVEEINGQPIVDIPSLIAAFDQTPENGIHTIKLDGQLDTIYLDSQSSDAVDKQLLLRGIPALSRKEE